MEWVIDREWDGFEWMSGVEANGLEFGDKWGIELWEFEAYSIFFGKILLI